MPRRPDLTARNTTHGLTGTFEHRVWIGMLARCRNPKAAGFARYGGAGVTVCARWTGWDGFAAFLADMGPAPTPRHTLERNDGRADYAPGNCRWATRTEQNRNTSRNVLLTHDGRTQCIAAWAEEIGMKKQTLYGRLARGLPAADALRTTYRYRNAGRA